MPFIIRDVIIEKYRPVIRSYSIDIFTRGVGKPEITHVKGLTFSWYPIPASHIAVFILGDSFVIAVASVVLFTKSLFEFFAGQFPDSIMIPSAVNKAGQFINIGRTAFAHQF